MLTAPGPPHLEPQLIPVAHSQAGYERDEVHGDQKARTSLSPFTNASVILIAFDFEFVDRPHLLQCYYVVAAFGEEQLQLGYLIFKSSLYIQ
jgi:hypothetical protein